MKTDIKSARASIIAQQYPVIATCMSRDDNFFELPFHIIDLLCFLIAVFGYKQPISQQEAGISPARSFYNYLKSGYEKLPF